MEVDTLAQALPYTTSQSHFGAGVSNHSFVTTTTATPPTTTTITTSAGKKSEEQQEVAPKKFYIFGHNISHSLSPALHNSGFRQLGLPHHYSIFETEGIDDSVNTLMRRPDFGGASVTFPHKLQVGKLLDTLTPVAKKVGAVNTVIVREEGGKRTLLGDNTDWLGIKACIESTGVTNLSSSTVLILGAGGAARAACHAIEMLGIKDLIIVNRTISKADDLASIFPNLRTRTFESFDGVFSSNGPPIQVVIGCVPADDWTEDKIPVELFAGAEHGVLVEMAYRPLVTGLMVAAGKRQGWMILQGVDVLEQQAYGQFELWTGARAPKETMRRAMRGAMQSH